MSNNVYSELKSSPFSSVEHESVPAKTEGEVKPRIYDLIPGRVQLISHGSSAGDDAATRARIASEFGLRLVPLEECIANRNRTELGKDGGGLPFSGSVGG